jgi:archaellum component FlaC
MAIREEVDRLIAELKTQRDELSVKVNLARKDARDEWEELEKKFEHLRARAEVVGREAGDAGQDVLKAARKVVEEIKKGYARIREVV